MYDPCSRCVLYGAPTPMTTQSSVPRQTARTVTRPCAEVTALSGVWEAGDAGADWVRRDACMAAVEFAVTRAGSCYNSTVQNTERAIRYKWESACHDL